MKKQTPVILAFHVFTSGIFAQTPASYNKQTGPAIAFTENKGQMHDQNYKLRPDVLYGVRKGDMSVHIRNNGLSYQLYRVDKYKEVEDFKTRQKRQEIELQTIYRIDLNWLHCHSNITKTEDKVLPGFDNYYYENCQDGVLKVRSYGGITLHNLYNGVDLHFYEKKGELKYDYIIAPHADYNQIQVQVQGAGLSVLDDGSLILSTPLGKIQEGAPIVFQNGRQLRARWKITGNTLRFEIDNYNPNIELLIDPITRLWSTYYGGSGDEYAYNCATDANSNVFITGFTNSNVGTVIVTSGSHQSTYGGSNDAFLVKFNSNGIRQWGTYYGGSSGDVGLSCVADATGNVYMSGSTTSSVGTAIATPGSHQPAFASVNNNYGDAFLVKFNSSGARLWGTYYGGNADDGAYSVELDPFGDVYIAGIAGLSQFQPGIATSGSHQQFNAGFSDAFLAKFNANGVRQWGTYYGGTSSDWGYSCSTDASGNVYLAGRTKSATAGTIIATPGSHQSAFGGGTNVEDAFLVKFNGSGVRQWGTFYGGSGNEFGFACATDVNGNIYLAGCSDSNTGTNTIIATPGSHQATFPAASFYIFSGFLVKFNALGTRQWGTYYGAGGSSEGIWSCKTDAIGNVYIAGNAASSGSLFATPGSHQTMSSGTYDGFLAKFSTNGTRLGGTYYGGSNLDYGYSCTVDPFGQVYLTGITQSSNAIVSNSGGTYQSFQSGLNDAYLVKFDACDMAPQTPVVSGPTVMCAGASTSYTAFSYGATLYVWSMPGGWFGSGVTSIVTPIAGSSGVFTITSSNPCGTSPQQTLSVIVNTLPVVSVNSGPLCTGQSYTITPSGSSTYSYVGGGPVVSPTVTTTYTVVGTNTTGCSNKAVCMVVVNPLPLISVNSGIICLGQSFTMIPTGAFTYTYSNGPVVSPTVSTSYSVVGTSAAGCVSSNTAVSQVTVSASPIPTVIVNNGVICEGDSFTIAPSGAVSYTIQGGSFVVNPTTSSSYTVNGTSAAGCITSSPAVSNITVNPLPLVIISVLPGGTVCAGETVTLTASGALVYNWNTSTSVTAQTITVNPGTTTSYTVTGTDGNTCINTATVTQIVDACTAIHTVAEGPQATFRVYPNPSNGLLYIQLNTESEITIIDALGQIMYAAKQSAGIHTLKTESWAKGVYVMRVSYPDKFYLTKLLLE